MAELKTRASHAAGVIMSDLLVAATLLSTAFLVFVPATARVLHMQQALRHDQLACDELNAQLESLSLLPVSALESHLRQLQLSDAAQCQLAGASIAGKMLPCDDAYRIELSLSWRDPGRMTKPMRMSMWVYPAKPQEEK